MRHSRLISTAALFACGQLLICGQLAGCKPAPPALKSPAAGVSPAEVAADTGTAPSHPGSADDKQESSNSFDTSAAVAQAAELTRLLLQGSTAEALQQFSPAYRDAVTIDALQALSDELRALLGDQVTQLEPIDSVLIDADAAAATQALRVRQLVEMASGKQAISATQFYLREDESSALTADLAAIEIRETWPSYSPGTHQLAHETVELLFATKTESTPSDTPPSAAAGAASQSRTIFEELLHPDLRPFLPAAKLSALIAQVNQHCGGLRRQPQWSLWGYQTDGEHISAVGNINSEQGEFEVQLDFSQEKLIGVTLIGDTFAVSTLDLLSPQPATAEHGKQFWRHIFADNLTAAYPLLATAFQQELSSDQFQQAIAESELIGESPLQDIELDALRFSNRLQRSAPVAFAAYYIATFEDGSQQAVQCEFGSQDSPPPLLAFTNDVQATIPSSDTAALQRIVKTFLKSDTDAVRQLLDQAAQDIFQPDVARSFLRQLRQLVGSHSPLQSMRVLHVYQGSTRVDHLRAEIKSDAKPVVFSGTLHGDELTSFNFLAPRLETFVHSIEDFEPIEEFGREFIRQWMDKDQTTQAVEKMIPAAEPEVLQMQLATQRDHLLGQHGHFLWSDLISWQALPGNNHISAIYELEFADKTLDMQLMFEVSAIAAKVSSARILEGK